MSLTMKNVLLLFCFLSFSSFAQKANLETVKSFWETIIIPITEYKEEVILKNTQFPLSGSWGYYLDLKEDEANWDQSVFQKKLHAVFSPEFRSRLKEMNFNYLVHHTDTEGKFHFILQVNFSQTKNGITSDLFYFLYFTQYDEVWKLYQIEIAG